MLKQYQVTLRPVGDTEPSGLIFLNAAPEAIASFDFTDDNGNEVYSIEIADAKANWLELQLDQTDNVISYTVMDDDEEVHPNDEEIEEELRQLADDTIYNDYPETEQEANHL